jgi:hypothetical protein
MIHKAQANCHQRQHKIKTEQMSFNQLTTPMRHPSVPYATKLQFGFISKEVKWYPETNWPWQIQQIVDNDRESDYQRLADLGAIDASQYVDAIRRKS